MKKRRSVGPLNGVAGLDVVLRAELDRAAELAESFFPVAFREGSDSPAPGLQGHQVDSPAVLCVGLGGVGHVGQRVPSCRPDEPSRGQDFKHPSVCGIFYGLEAGSRDRFAEYQSLRTSGYNVLHEHRAATEVKDFSYKLESSAAVLRVIETLQSRNEHSVGSQHTFRGVVGHGHVGLSICTIVDTPATQWGQRPIPQGLLELFRVWPLGQFVDGLVFFLTSSGTGSKRGGSFFLTAGPGQDLGDQDGSRFPLFGEDLVALVRPDDRLHARGQ